MNDHEKDAVATFLSQVVKAVKCIMDLASKLWRKVKECYDITVSRVIDSEKERTTVYQNPVTYRADAPTVVRVALRQLTQD